MHPPCRHIWLKFGAGSGVWAGRVRRDVHNVARDVSDRSALLELGGGQHLSGVGRADRRERLIPGREFTQVH
jgi:hypothetical protein